MISPRQPKYFVDYYMLIVASRIHSNYAIGLKSKTLNNNI